MPRRHYLPFILTDRDREILEYVCEMRGVPIEHIAELFFSADPYTRKPNKNPRRACERRLRELVRAGHVALERQSDGVCRRQLVVLANRSNATTRKRARRRRSSVRNGVHHVRTQDALIAIERELERGGARVLSRRLDQDVRAADMRGRRTQFGDSYEAAPDAVLKVCTADGDVIEIAVEYVTSKYTDADILKKHESFARYDRVIWVSDRQRTAERVAALTGESCTTLK